MAAFRSVREVLLEPVSTVPACWPPSPLLSLPFDAWVDHILAHLNVEDIIALRLVCKQFHDLTYEPIIWKRLLQLIKYPLPPLPPSSRYTDNWSALTCLEAERLVIRSISLDDNWRSKSPMIYGNATTFTGLEILEMVLLPGGKYLVASVCNPGYKMHSIGLFVLDRPSGEPKMLARMPTVSRAYELQAKYMVLNGVPGIMIGFLRCSYKERYRGPRGEDPYELSKKKDCTAIRYEATCKHAPLELLERLGEKLHCMGRSEIAAFGAKQDLPFHRACYHRSKQRLSNLTLDEILGVSHMSVLKDPNTILIKDLTDPDSPEAQILCRNPGGGEQFNMRICAFRVIAIQQQILVVRRVTLGEEIDEDSEEDEELDNGAFYQYIAELHDLPSSGETVVREATDYLFLEDVGGKKQATFYISDPCAASNYDASTLKPSKAPVDPPPIHVFYYTGDRDTFHHVAMLPIPFPGDEGQPASSQVPHFYDLENAVVQSDFDFSHRDVLTRVIPGSYRSLMWLFEKDTQGEPKTVDFFSYISPNRTDPDDPEIVSDKKDYSSPITRGRSDQRDELVAWLGSLPPKLARAIQIGGMLSVAWDEAIGRICVCAKGDHHLHVLDLAQNPEGFPEAPAPGPAPSAYPFSMISADPLSMTLRNPLSALADPFSMTF